MVNIAAALPLLINIQYITTIRACSRVLGLVLLTLEIVACDKSRDTPSEVGIAEGVGEDIEVNIYTK